MRGNKMMDQIRLFARRYINRTARRRIARLAVWPPVGWVQFGQLRRTKPFTTDFGLSRGLEIDRYYIEKFLAENAQDICGHVLEIKHNAYTLKFGQERVTKSDVLHKLEGNPDATIVADLTNAPHIPSDTYDTIIITQTLQVIYDLRSVIATLYRILKPGGVVLATVSGICAISRQDYEMWGEYWRLTSLSARLLFEETFPSELVKVQAYGNVLASIAFLEGLAFEDLSPKELDVRDPNYEISIAIWAKKPANAA
jgi:SAM-dependent methyltransferase